VRFLQMKSTILQLGLVRIAPKEKGRNDHLLFYLKIETELLKIMCKNTIPSSILGLLKRLIDMKMKKAVLFMLLFLPSIIKAYDGSVYSNSLHGSQVASSRGYYDRNRLTCATGSEFKLGTKLRITYKNRSVIVVVNDRIGRRFYGKRIDLSGKAFKQLYPKYNFSDKTGTLLKNIKVEKLTNP